MNHMLVRVQALLLRQRPNNVVEQQAFIFSHTIVQSCRVALPSPTCGSLSAPGVTISQQARRQRGGGGQPASL